MSDSLFELVPGGTDRAVGIAVDPDPCPFHCQCIEQKQGTCQRRADTGGEFQGFGCLHGADNPDQRCENANLRGFQILEMLVFRKQAGVTGGIITPWIVNRDLPVELDDGTRIQVERPAAMQARLTIRRVLKLSVQSRTTSAVLTSSGKDVSSIRSVMVTISIVGLMPVSVCFPDSALFLPIRSVE